MQQQRKNGMKETANLSGVAGECECLAEKDKDVENADGGASSNEEQDGECLQGRKKKV